MQLKDGKKFLGGLNSDDNPANLPEGDYTDLFNARSSNSNEQHGQGLVETLQGEIPILISPDTSITYYGSAIGGSFVYGGNEEVTIGTQTWMQKNYDKDYPGSKAYSDDEGNVLIYGRLYTHEQIMQPDFCPSGWRVPTEADIDILLTYLGGLMIAGGVMKNVGTGLWADPNTGAVDSYGFRAVPGGKFDTLFDLLGDNCLLWLQDDGEPLAPVALNASEITPVSFKANWKTTDGATGYYLDVATDLAFTAFVAGFNNKDVGNVLVDTVSILTPETPYYFRVRAYNEVGTSGNSNIQTLTTSVGIVDVDGNIYTAVTIGTQQWLVENLKTTKYADGTPIPNLTLDADWIAEDGTVGHDGAYCYYNNDIANKADYGALYNWYAVDNAQGLVPTGWRVPSKADWDALIAYVGGYAIGGGKLKEAGITHWETPNKGAVDLYGFKGLPSGYRKWDNGDFEGFTGIGKGQYGNHWTTTQHNATFAYMAALLSQYENVNNSTTYKPYGYAVRCMRDIP